MLIDERFVTPEMFYLVGKQLNPLLNVSTKYLIMHLYVEQGLITGETIFLM